MDLQSNEIKKLVGLIKDSFRVRQNVRPVYVDVADNLERLGSPQHQVIFGRRGSGKSCLLVEYLSSTPRKEVTPIYILADEFKRLAYPDILIRLLIEVLDGVGRSCSWHFRCFRRRHPLREASKELRRLLDVAEEADVSEGQGRVASDSIGANVNARGLANATITSGTQASSSRTSTFRERKIDHLERHLRDYKTAIIDAAHFWRSSRGCLLVDDFYLIPREWQPDVVDYLHRLLRDTSVYLKVATIRHRTRLLRNHPQTVGIELSQDVEEINLDRTLEDLDETRDFLGRMLQLMGSSVGVGDVEQVFNPDAMQALTLASGGVPRDFLTLFVHAVDIAVADGKPRWITPTYVYRGASRMSYQTKLRHLREDAYGDASGLERVLVDLITFCLKDKKKTGFLISQDESQKFSREHDIVQQLMDFKLIHVIEPDTSAASSRSGRYEAYTLDFSIFMEPRRRGIEIVEFWKRGEDRHRIGVRELPTYPLERVGRAFDDLTSNVDVESFLEEQEKAAEADNINEERSRESNGIQGSLFEPERGEGSV